MRRALDVTHAAAADQTATCPNASRAPGAGKAHHTRSRTDAAACHGKPWQRTRKADHDRCADEHPELAGGRHVLGKCLSAALNKAGCASVAAKSKLKQQDVPAHLSAKKGKNCPPLSYLRW